MGVRLLRARAARALDRLLSRGPESAALSAPPPAAAAGDSTHPRLKETVLKNKGKIADH